MATPMPASSERIRNVRRDWPAATLAAPGGNPIAKAIENSIQDPTAKAVTIDSPLVSRSASCSRSAMASRPYAAQMAATSTIALPTEGVSFMRRRSWSA